MVAVTLVLGAIGGVVQVVKTLYQYYELGHQNRQVLDVLEGFSQNLQITIERLKAREALLGSTENEALDSIAKDFENAEKWLISNDKSLRSYWTILQAADKLRDLDNRLMKAFTSKMAAAIFHAVLDNREATQKVQRTLDGMQGNLETAVREASREGVQAAIEALKEEAYQARGGGDPSRGFSNGEAEKIISQLVDQISAQERLREEEEYRALHTSYPPLEPAPHTSRRHSHLDPFSDRAVARNGSQVSTASTEPSLVRHGGVKGRKRVSQGITLPTGTIAFMPFDPTNQQDLIDPVLCNDGIIHERWSLVDGAHENLLDPEEPLLIVGDVVQLRNALFETFPDRRLLYEAKRQAYREETIALYEQGGPEALPEVIDRLSHLVLLEPDLASHLTRRGIALYRLRELARSLADLTKAIEVSTRDPVTRKSGKREPDLDALRARAVVRDELHDYAGAKDDIRVILRRSPTDILALSLRAGMKGLEEDLRGAQTDLLATNSAVEQDTTYRCQLGDSDVDLEYLSRGWAFMNISDFSSAQADFQYSLDLRSPREPYTLACLGLAKVKSGLNSSSKSLVRAGFVDLDESIKMQKAFGALYQDAASVGRSTSGTLPPMISEGGLPIHAFSCFFLRGMAYFAKQDLMKSLSDFKQAIALRPKEVLDTGEFHLVLAQLRIAAGDREGAAKDFDMAVALTPENRSLYQSLRESAGVQ